MGELRRLYYQTKDYYSFKRYMWRWDKTVSANSFQMGRIKINDVDLPYSYINSARGSGTGSSYGENADKMLIAESTGGYDKWIIFNLTSGSDSTWGYVIFELPIQVEAKTYRLKTTNDSSAGNYPRRMRLYGTNDETSDPDSVSWTLISDVESFTFPTGHFEWSNEIPINPRETNNYYLLAPSDISRGSGLRYEVQSGGYTVLFNTDSEYNYGNKVNFNLPSTVSDRYILYKWHGTIRTGTSSFGASDYFINERLLQQRAHYAHSTVGFAAMDSTYRPQFVPSYEGVFSWIQDGQTCYTDNSYPCQAGLSGTNRLIVDQTDSVGHIYWRPDVDPDSYPNYKGYIVYSNGLNLVATQLSIDNEINYYPKADHISVVSSNDIQTLIDY